MGCTNYISLSEIDDCCGVPDIPRWRARPISVVCKLADKFKDDYGSLVRIFADVEAKKEHYQLHEYEYIKEFIGEKIENLRSKEIMSE